MDRKVVLIVEDNDDERMIYRTLLNHRGYETLTASDFDTALQIARSRSPDAVIVDINLGEGKRDGCDLVQALRADRGTSAIAVIAHTAFGDVYSADLERAGCQQVLHKPTSPSVLLDALERLIGPP